MIARRTRYIPALTLAVLVLPRFAAAAPSIATTSPGPATGPLYDVQPVLAFTFSSDDPSAPIDPSTLRILVNGADWTGRFSVDPGGSASYRIPAVDALVAGEAAACASRCALSVQASIADTKGQRASVAQAWDVGPTLTAVSPSVGSVGASVAIGGLGLDPATANNAVVFAAPSPPGPITVPFATVDSTRRSGTALVPEGAVSGTMRLQVNGVEAREALPFGVLTDLPFCGDVGRQYGQSISLSSGEMLVYYGHYAPNASPVCPQVGHPIEFGSHLGNGPVVLFHARDRAELVWDSNPNKNNHNLRVIAIAVEKGGLNAAVLEIRDVWPDNIVVNLLEYQQGGKYQLKGTSYVSLPEGVAALSADFDRAGNLYLAHTFVTPTLFLSRILQLSKDTLTSGSTVAPIVVSEPSLGPGEVAFQLALRCDGAGYFATLDYGHYLNRLEKVHKIDLSSGNLIGEIDPAQSDLDYIGGIAVTCHGDDDGDEVWGTLTRLNDQNWDVETILWRATNGARQPGEVLRLPQSWANQPTVAPGGDVYLPIYPQYVNSNGILKLPALVTPCKQDGSTEACTAQAYCSSGPAAITILTSTTRWKPQRDLTRKIEVKFKGPSDLETAKLLITEVKGSDGKSVPFPTDYVPDTEPFVPTAKDAEGNYQLKWKAGPLPDGKLLPTGNYTLVVEGTRKDEPNDLLKSDPFSRVSIAEVVKIELQAFNGSVLDTNPGPGGGDRIFAEATAQATPSNPYPKIYDKVRVIATIEPPVEAVPNQESLKVHFRVLDVDDPSASGGKVDDEGKPTDNRADVESLAGLFSEPPPEMPSPGPGQPPPRPVPNALVGIPLSKEAAGLSEISVYLRVSPRQGDNYRLAASTSEEWVSPAKLRAQQKTTPDGPLPAGWLQGEDSKALDPSLQCGSQNPSCQVTPMVTVWRTLHLEVDQLVSADPDADQRRMDVRGSFTRLKATSLEDSTAPFKNDPKADKARLNDWVLHERDNDWVGGDLTLAFHPADTYNVWTNDKDSVGVTIGRRPDGTKQPDLLDGKQDADITDRNYALRDDNIASLNESADYALARDLLTRAYIHIEKADQTDEKARIPFVIDRRGDGVDRRHMGALSLKRLPAEVAPSEAFWAVSLISAFDGPPEKDLDPQTEADFDPRKDKEGFGFGRADIGWYTDENGAPVFGHLRAAIFLETIRDLSAKPPTKGFDRGFVPKATLNQRATAHELLHTLKIPHGKAIMCANDMVQPGDAGGRITDDHLATLRALPAPTLSASKKATCE